MCYLNAFVWASMYFLSFDINEYTADSSRSTIKILSKHYLIIDFGVNGNNQCDITIIMRN